LVQVEFKKAMSPTKKQRTPLSSIRSLLLREKFDAFIVGSGDAHQSEYVCETDMRRKFISGFTGSAGTALILDDKALLWTDGRYFLQGEMELSKEWTLMKSLQPGVLDMNEWLAANLKPGQTVGVDAFLMSTAEAKKMVATLKSAGINVRAATVNPVDIVWNAEGSRPPASCGAVKIHDMEYAGLEHTAKIATLQKSIQTADASSLVVSMLDEVGCLEMTEFKSSCTAPVTPEIFTYIHFLDCLASEHPRLRYRIQSRHPLVRGGDVGRRPPFH
jgi:Xaa-Pro aminopeptidase